ncbi:hypothetical protein D9M71_299840 [compost metagenome]
MDAYADALGRARDAIGPYLAVALVVVGVVVQPAGTELALVVTMQLVSIASAAVDPGAGLHGLVFGLREEFVVALVRPALSRRASFGGGIHGPVQEGGDRSAPRVLVAVVGIFSRQRIHAREAQERIQFCTRWAAAGNYRVLFRSRSGLRHGESAGIRVRIGIEGFRPELLEQHQLLVERLGAEQRARLAVGGDIERGLLGGWQDVVLQGSATIACNIAGLHEGPGVGFFLAVEEYRLGILGRIGVGRGVARGGLAGYGHGCGYRQSQQKQCAGKHGGAFE